MGDRNPLPDVHRQMDVHKDNDSDGPQAAEAPDVNGAVPVREDWHIEENQALPQGVGHGDPEEAQIVALVAVP